MLIPLRTCSLYNQTPLPNWGIIAASVLVWVASVGSGFGGWVEGMVLHGVSMPGLLGHMFLHAGVLHLAGNMVFLWVFGNVVCAKVGPYLYVPVYLLCGIGAAFCHLLASDFPAIGASGAINGIIAFYLVLQPVNEVEMLLIFFLRVKQFTIAGFWVILYWLAWDVYGLLGSSQSRVGFAAHVGGFATGLVLGTLCVFFKLVQMDKYDNPTLLEYLGLLPKGYSAPKRQRAKTEPIPQRAYEPPVAQSHRQPPPPPRPPVHFPAKSPEPQPPPAAAKVQSFPCPHCQAELELDLATLDTRSTLHCPACKGKIHLELE